MIKPVGVVKQELIDAQLLTPPASGVDKGSKEL